MSAYIGAKVHLSTSEGVYEGIIHDLDLKINKISLKKVVVLPSRKKLTGIHNFFSTDIDNLIVIDVSDTPDKVLQSPCVSRPKEDDVVRPTVQPTQHDQPYEDRSRSTDVAASPRPKKIPRAVYKPDDLVIITKLDDVYYEAVENLQKESVIGLAMEGIDIGRNGKLSLVQFSTTDRLYIFDIGCIGRKAFGNGLGDILESEHIEKVIHDCRPISDLVYHEYGLTLKSIFDTQVADVVVFKRNNQGRLPRLIKTLPICMMEYMDNVEQEDISFMLIHEKRTKGDPGLWEERPLDNQLIKYADFKVRSLLTLRRMLTHYMMNDFRTGVNEYLSVWRDKTCTREKERVSAFASVPKSVNTTFQNVPPQSQQDETTECYFDRDVVGQQNFWSRADWKEGRQFHDDDDNEKFSWYRKMQEEHTSAANDSAYSDSKYCRSQDSRKPSSKQHMRNTTTDTERNKQEIRIPIVNRHLRIPDEDLLDNLSSSTLPSSSDNEITSTSTSSSPYKAHSLKTSSPYRVLSNSIKREALVTSEQKVTAQISTLTLKSISRDLQTNTLTPPPLISSEGSMEDAIPNVSSYASAVSGKRTVNHRADSPGFTGMMASPGRGRGRGETMKSYRQLIDKFKKPEEVPVPTLHGKAVRCDFPSDSVVRNAPRGITITNNRPNLSMADF
ncbi:uncharacterized protein [Antedon mediterranea]|uniref:uncharacterized protein n=1 Tax=Antedon mediterranea TaxID=105859 RepID=UPI003AF594AB